MDLWKCQTLALRLNFRLNCVGERYEQRLIDISHCGLVYERDKSRLEVYRDFNLHIAQGESLVLIGSSGCGKSTLLYLIAGLLNPSEGEIRIEGQLVREPRQQSAFILQEYGLFPWLTVEDNVSLGLRVRGWPRRHYRPKVRKLVADMGLEEVHDHFPGQLSGGQRQRVALARALSLEPNLLLMDEPLSALDALTRERLQYLLLDIWRREHLTAVLVTHSIEEAVFLGRRILVLADRRPTEILGEVDNPEVGTDGYRGTELFYRRCSTVRALLEGRGEK
ncbi:ABC transporter ATP-binding protein [Paradesulfitobacterium aromaticivorans]